MTPAYALAHVFLPNLVRIKGATTVVGVIERKEKFFFDAVWSQAQVEHQPFLLAQTRSGYNVGVVGLPAPSEMGEAYYAGTVSKPGELGYVRYFLLERDYVLATKADRTLLTEREGNRHTKHGEGPALTGNHDTDAVAFVDAFMELIVPTKVTKPDRSW